MDYVGDKARLEEFCAKHLEIMVFYGCDGAILSAWCATVQNGKGGYWVEKLLLNLCETMYSFTGN